MSHKLALYLFGSPSFQLDDVAVEITSQKTLALLVYLVVSGVSHRRDALADLFWPGYTQSYARTYLRQSLHELSKTLGHYWFEVNREQIGLAEKDSIQTDVGDFRRLLAAGRKTPDAISEAIALYKEVFMAGFSLPDCPEFEQWQLLESENLRHTLAQALQELLRWHTGQRDYATAIAVARRWLALDRYYEAAHRSLMQLYSCAGEETAALRQYEECKRLLSEALQTAPDPETQTLYEQIRSRRLPPRSISSAPSASSLPATSPLPLPSFLSEQIAITRGSNFVARKRELEELAGALASARAGSGQILFVIGGAGRGKSMLIQEFARRAQSEYADLLVASGACNAYTGIGDPYLPFREILLALSGDVEAKVAGGLTAGQDARRLWEAMPTSLPALTELAPDLLAAFVPVKPLQARAESVAGGNAPWVRQLQRLANGEQRLYLEERQLFSQFTDALKAIADHHPLLLILEDLHWVDTASNSLLLHLSRTIGESRILVVGSYRPDELMASRQVDRQLDRHPLATIVGELKRQHGDIWLDLAALSTDEGRTFVDAYLDTQPNRLAEEFRAMLFRHTGGHALFTVELVREMRARGDLIPDAEGFWVAGQRINWSVLPAKVEGVIEQRIGHLEKGLQQLLAVASIEGESFTAEVVARVQGQAEYEVVQRLSQALDRDHRLVRVESLERVGRQRLSRYRFRHHLFQQYLYHRLSDSERAYLHEKVGDALEELYAGESGRVAVQLAHHFEQADLAEKAVTYLAQAGQHAYRLSAYQEAIPLLTRALALLASLPETRSHAQDELALRISLGRALHFIINLGSEESRKHYLRAYELCQQVGDDHALYAVLHGLYSSNTPAVESGLSIAQQMLQVAESQSNPIYRVSAHHVLGNKQVYRGEYAAALAHLEQSVALYEPRHHQEYLLLCGQDEGIAALANLSLTLCYLGYPDQALHRGQEAIAITEELAHPMSLFIAKHFTVHVHLLRGEVQIAHQIIDELLELGREQGTGIVLIFAALYRGDALLLEGRVHEAIEHMERTRETFRATLGPGDLFINLDLADAYSQIGDFGRGLSLLDKAQAGIEEFALFEELPLLYRIKGDLYFAQALAAADSPTFPNRLRHMDEAEAAFTHSIEISRAQQAKTMELKATLALCRLWQYQGKLAKARSALAEIYGWFTEGFDTADLVAAKALLEELNRAP